MPCKSSNNCLHINLRHRATLEDSQEGAGNHQLGKIVYERRTQGDKPKAGNEERNYRSVHLAMYSTLMDRIQEVLLTPEASTDFLEDDITRYLDTA